MPVRRHSTVRMGADEQITVGNVGHFIPGDDEGIVLQRHLTTGAQNSLHLSFSKRFDI